METRRFYLTVVFNGGRKEEYGPLTSQMVITGAAEAVVDQMVNEAKVAEVRVRAEAVKQDELTQRRPDPHRRLIIHDNPQA